MFYYAYYPIYGMQQKYQHDRNDWKKQNSIDFNWRVSLILIELEARQWRTIWSESVLVGVFWDPTYYPFSAPDTEVVSSAMSTVSRAVLQMSIITNGTRYRPIFTLNLPYFWMPMLAEPSNNLHVHRRCWQSRKCSIIKKCWIKQWKVGTLGRARN